MKEMRVLGGDCIEDACVKLAAAAPAYMVFNDIHVEARGGESASDLLSFWRKEADRRHAEYLASDRYKRHQAEQEASDQRNKIIRDEALATVEVSGIRERFPWVDTMREVSGFGGSYEQACRDMLYAGLLWMIEHQPREDTREPDAHALKKVLVAACPDCSGAMFGAVMSACMYIAKNGWSKYVEEMSK